MNQSAISLLLFICIILTSCSNKNNTLSPNVVILLADDLGSTDLACFGGEARTPNLDKLAITGIKFTNFYAPAPNCSPSRAGLLTGRMPSRVGMYNYRAAKQDMHLPEHEITLAEYLQVKGYQTAHFGKWHLGCLPQDSTLHQPQPFDHGFEYSLGTSNNAIPSHLNPTNFIRNGEAVGETEGYSCQIVAREIKNWFTTSYNKEKPFFLYVAFHEVHSKIASPQQMLDHYPGETKKDAEYLANIENMDNASGKIISELKKRGLLKNTLVIFASDNGPYNKGSAGELRGLKGEVYDGGIRVPGIIHWPAKLTGGKVIDTPAGLVDILPTLANLCNVSLSTNRTLDGADLTPLLKGYKFERKTPLMWFYYRSFPEVSLRIDNYVLIGNALDSVPRTHPMSDLDMKFVKSIEIKEFELYDIVNDPGQKKNLMTLKPAVASRMKPHMLKLLDEIKAEGPFWENLYKYEDYKSKFKKEYIR